RRLADARLRRARASRDHHFRVLLVPRAHVHEIRLLAVEHLAEVRVALVFGNAKEIAELAPRVGMRVGERSQLDWLARHALPRSSVDACDRAASNKGGSVASHYPPLNQTCSWT